jgi:hypothetical protein
MTAFGLTFEAAYGGGPLHQWNQLLWAMHCAEVRHQKLGSGEVITPRTHFVSVKVVPPTNYDPDGSSSMMLLDATGSPFSFPIPNRGVTDEANREALIQTALSRLPSGPMVEPSLRSMMPQVGHDLLQSAEHWWHQQLGVAKEGDARTDLPDSEVPTSLPSPENGPQIIWVGPRQHRAIKELRLDPADAIGGEAHLKQLLLNRKPSEIPRLIRELEQSIRAHSKTIGSAVKNDSPNLYGSFTRYKRSLNRANKEFQRSSDRHFRNHKGIRTNRLKHLAQALKPGDLEQQKGLSLISAMALFHLQPSQAVEQSELFHDANPQDILLVNCETGIRSLISLSC